MGVPVGKSMREYIRLGDRSPSGEECGYLSHYEKTLRLGYLMPV